MQLCRRNPHYQTVVTSVRLGDLDTVRDLLELGLAQVDWLYRGASLLCLSVCRGDGEMVELLTRAGADVNRFYTYQGYSETALIAAVRLGYENIARSLALHPGTEVDAVDSAGKSALQFAVETRRPGLVSLLLQAGARIPPTLLHTAIKFSGYITGQEISFLLIRHGAKLEVEDELGRTALSWAVFVNNQELVWELLRLGGRSAKVSPALLALASTEIREMMERSRKEVVRLELLASGVIRRCLVSSSSNNYNRETQTFSQRLQLLPLPDKLKCFNCSK